MIIATPLVYGRFGGVYVRNYAKDLFLLIIQYTYYCNKYNL